MLFFYLTTLLPVGLGVCAGTYFGFKTKKKPSHSLIVKTTIKIFALLFFYDLVGLIEFFLGWQALAIVTFVFFTDVSTLLGGALYQAKSDRLKLPDLPKEDNFQKQEVTLGVDDEDLV